MNAQLIESSQLCTQIQSDGSLPLMDGEWARDISASPGKSQPEAVSSTRTEEAVDAISSSWI